MRALGKYAGKARFKVGDVVRFMFVRTHLVGRVVEDRGRLGVGGRRLYGIDFVFNEEPSYMELREEDLQPADGPAPR